MFTERIKNLGNHPLMKEARDIASHTFGIRSYKWVYETHADQIEDKRVLRHHAKLACFAGIGAPAIERLAEERKITSCQTLLAATARDITSWMFPTTLTLYTLTRFANNGITGDIPTDFGISMAGMLTGKLIMNGIIHAEINGGYKKD